MSKPNEITNDDLRHLLVAKRAELTKALSHREDISIVPAADVLDALQLSQERSLAVESLDLNARLLRQVEATLERMNEGGYGSCLQCDEPIPDRRLRALPWAVRCIGCQEREERRHPRGSSMPLEEAA